MICGHVAFPTTNLIIDTADDEPTHNTLMQALSNGDPTICITSLTHHHFIRAGNTTTGCQEAVGTRCELMSYDRTQRRATCRGVEKCLLKRIWVDGGAWADFSSHEEPEGSFSEKLQRHSDFIRREAVRVHRSFQQRCAGKTPQQPLPLEAGSYSYPPSSDCPRLVAWWASQALPFTDRQRQQLLCLHSAADRIEWIGTFLVMLDVPGISQHHLELFQIGDQVDETSITYISSTRIASGDLVD